MGHQWSPTDVCVCDSVSATVRERQIIEDVIKQFVEFEDNEYEISSLTSMLLDVLGCKKRSIVGFVLKYFLDTRATEGNDNIRTTKDIVETGLAHLGRIYCEDKEQIILKHKNQAKQKKQKKQKKSKNRNHQEYGYNYTYNMNRENSDDVDIKMNSKYARGGDDSGSSSQHPNEDEDSKNLFQPENEINITPGINVQDEKNDNNSDNENEETDDDDDVMDEVNYIPQSKNPNTQWIILISELTQSPQAGMTYPCVKRQCLEKSLINKNIINLWDIDFTNENCSRWTFLLDFSNKKEPYKSIDNYGVYAIETEYKRKITTPFIVRYARCDNVSVVSFSIVGCFVFFCIYMFVLFDLFVLNTGSISNSGIGLCQRWYYYCW